MNIESLRRWHWIVIGIIGGYLVGWALSSFNLTPMDSQWRRPISEVDLASALTDELPSDPDVTNLVVHAEEDGRTFVTGEHRTRHKFQSFAIYTGRPFPAGGNDQAADIREYINRLTAIGHPIAMRELWWETKWFKLTAPPVAGMIIIGGIWPTILNLMIGAGFGRKKPPEEAYDLDRFGKDSPPPLAASAVTAEQHAQVAESAKRIEEALKESAEAAPATLTSDLPAIPSTPVILTGGPLEASAVSANTDPKEYEGQFYPVVKPGRSPTDSNGFSLVELLVIVGIIAILIAMLAPALTTARRSAAVVACAANVRQLGYAMQSYLNENHGTTFWRGDRLQGDGMDWYAYGGRETGNANLDTSDYFNETILPRPLNIYIGKQLQVFHCPNDQSAPWTYDASSTSNGKIYPADSHFNWVGNSYNFNANGYPLRPLPRHDGGLDEVKYSSIQDSSHMIVFYEASLYWGGDWHYKHQGNIGFADGHVSFLPLPPWVGVDHWDP